LVRDQGGRRLKSSLPDQFFSNRYTPFQFLKILAVGKKCDSVDLAGFPARIFSGDPINKTALESNNISRKASIKVWQGTSNGSFYGECPVIDINKAINGAPVRVIE
jgi:hypothetical protein